MWIITHFNWKDLRNNIKKIGSGQGTLLTGWTTAGDVKFWSGNLQGGPMTWWKLREPAGYEKRETDRCGDTWGKPVSSSGRQSADMMMMNKKKLVGIWHEAVIHM